MPKHTADDYPEDDNRDGDGLDAARGILIALGICTWVWVAGRLIYEWAIK